MSNWNDFFASVERFYTQTARLLRDADELLGERGLRAAKGKETNAGMQTGTQLSVPSLWFPGWMSRHYIEVADDDTAIPRWYVAIIAHRRVADTDVPDLPTPIVTAGVWTFEKSESWFYSMAKAWCWADERPTDGTVVKRPLRVAKVVGEAQCFAVPLDSIKNDDDLRTRVIEPLVAIEKLRPPPPPENG